jgi:FkbM family methyltransferase
MRVMTNLLNRIPASWIRAASAVRGSSASIKSATDWLPDLLRNREGRIQRGLGRGLRFHGGSSAVGFLLGTHDLELQYAMSKLLKPGMIVYDLGANVGFTAILAARQVAPSGRVICFEPLAVNAERIHHNAALNGFGFVEVRQIAVGATDGEAEFLLSESPTWGRLAQSGPAPKQSGVTVVPVRSLDSLFEHESLPAPQIIKMDVEGGEAAALLGAKRLLATSRPVMIIELHHTYHAVMSALEGLDFVVRPLVRGEVASLDDEFQILAYPRERGDAEVICSEVAAGRMVFT